MRRAAGWLAVCGLASLLGGCAAYPGYGYGYGGDSYGSLYAAPIGGYYGGGYYGGYAAPGYRYAGAAYGGAVYGRGWQGSHGGDWHGGSRPGATWHGPPPDRRGASAAWHGGGGRPMPAPVARPAPIGGGGHGRDGRPPPDHEGAR
ncbi:MAG TPA: hypothetical protein VHY76_15985 [Acetobacteraceae bacterium]|nr:hypothetical protein [Acetobacteraceae bacterium]